MKMLVLMPAVFLLASNLTEAADNAYAIGAYRALSTETVIVFGPAESCDATFLAALREAIKPTIAPSLTEIGYACASHDQIVRLNLNEPICMIVAANTPPDTPPVWIYSCYRGAVDRFINPPSQAELEKQRETQQAANAAQQQATELARKRLDERMAWQRYAIAWVYQREKNSCLQRLNAHRAPGQDDPAPLCDRNAKNGAAANPTLAVFQFCKYLRSVGQTENTIHAACDTAVDKPFNVMPPTTIMAPIN